MILLATTLAGCGAPDEPADGNDLAGYADDGKADALGGTRVCATQHLATDADGDRVVFCDKLFTTRGFVRPAADKLSMAGISTLYVAFDLAGQTTAIDRNGTTYTLVDGQGRPTNNVPTNLHFPSHRAMYFIYKVTGGISTVKDPYSGEPEPSLRIKSAKPFILLTGKAIDGAFEGAWEGTVSKRLTADSWDSSTQVPIRIRFTKLVAMANLPPWNNSGTLRDGTRFQLVGEIENWDRSIEGSDGTCLQPLSALRSKNPFEGGTDGGVQLWRFPGMHFPSDEVTVLEYPHGTTGLTENGMGGMSVLHPAGFLQTQSSEIWGEQSIRPHGPPNGHQMTLHPVAGGGGGC